MNWTRIALAGVAAGVVTNVCEFIVHGLLLPATYTGLAEAFDRTQANPLYFLALSGGIALVMAVQGISLIRAHPAAVVLSSSSAPYRSARACSPMSGRYCAAEGDPRRRGSSARRR